MKAAVKSTEFDKFLSELCICGPKRRGVLMKIKNQEELVVFLQKFDTNLDFGLGQW